MQDENGQRALLPGRRIRARGAVTNATGRFEPRRVEAVDDGWDMAEEERLVATEVRLERPRSALSFNKSPDIPFDRSINPYRGCEHGCIYCFARPTHAYLNLSPALDFETRLIARPGIGAVLERELRTKSYKVATVAIGTNTDPYQPCEKDHGVMREVVEVLSAFNHPLAITTKGTLIERDLDLLAPMAAKGLLRVGVSVTTLDAGLSRSMEPRAALPARRLEVIRRLAEAGITVRVMVAPVIPGLTDHEMEPILQAAAEAGAKGASWIMLRLPLEVAPLFRDWIGARHGGHAAKVMARVREARGGKDYDAEWGKRMRGEGMWSELIGQRFRLAVARYGLDMDLPALRCDLFQPPARAGDQLALF
ncbi:PA0069 family radical SAM protein [Paragemmobacter straminiformis]|uniref:PA0069 family radical SAM protein n=1 Tax=Paragemmobacter straminiformis TaxID=2045119 RepID=A0A842ICP2_9RHOB|nr:PA0069 family radical SAM protein [Gemmobacter straminiformis]MBC2837306.1 PA0069 family radical SAM protein [Gemmobacter straminiformis]